MNHKFSLQTLKIVEFRGKEIVKYIFEKLSESDNLQLMPIDCRRNYEHADDSEKT